MSQFIQLNNTLPQQTPSILKGILSKIIQPKAFSMSNQQKPLNSSSLKFSPNSTSLHNETLKVLFKQKVDRRFIQEVKLADHLQNTVMGQEYGKMKQNLHKYAKSQNLKINKILPQRTNVTSEQIQGYGTATLSQFVKNPTVNFSKALKSRSTSSLIQNPQPYFHSINKTSIYSPLNNSFANANHELLRNFIKNEQKQKKMRFTVGSLSSSHKQNQHDRVVFVDRKYNNEFSIKLANYIEAQQITAIKDTRLEKLRSDMDKKRPLVDKANYIIKNGSRERRKFHSDYAKQCVSLYEKYEKEPIQKLGLIQKQKTNKPYKAQRKILFSLKKRSLSEQKQPLQLKNKYNAHQNNKYPKQRLGLGNIKLNKGPLKQQLKQPLLVKKKRQNQKISTFIRLEKNNDTSVIEKKRQI